MKAFTLFLLAAVMSGCATGPFSEKRDLESSSQQQGTVISCSGYKTWQDCNNEAAKLCANGYEVLAKEENINMQARSIRISCK